MRRAGNLWDKVTSFENLHRSFFHDDKGYLREVRAEIVAFLAGLRQTLNQGKSRIRRVKEGIEFLGFVVFPDQMRLNRTAVRRQRRRVRRLRREYAEWRIDWPRVKASLEAWNAHVAHGTTWRLRRDVFQETVFVRTGRAQDAYILALTSGRTLG